MLSKDNIVVLADMILDQQWAIFGSLGLDGQFFLGLSHKVYDAISSCGQEYTIGGSWVYAYFRIYI